MFLKIDGTDDDALIESLQMAAEIYLINSGIDKDYTNDLYKLAVKLLIIHWYENREVIGKADKLAFSLETIIFSIKYSQLMPTVTIVPLDLAIGILQTASIVLTFSTEVKVATIVESNIFLTKDGTLIPATLSVDVTGKIVTLVPVNILEYGSYIICVNNVTSPAGLPVNNITSTFVV